MDPLSSEFGWWPVATFLIAALVIGFKLFRLGYLGDKKSARAAETEKAQSFDELFDQIPVYGRPTPGYVFGEGQPNGIELREHLNKTLPNLSFEEVLARYPNMDPKKRAILVKIQELGFREPNLKEPLRIPVLSIEEFFDGNDLNGAIAANLEPQPGNQYFRNALTEIRSDPEVSFVVLDTWHLYASGESEPDWPAAEFVYVGGSIPESKLLKWQDMLKADDVLPGWEDGVFPRGLPASLSSTPVYRFWWD